MANHLIKSLTVGFQRRWRAGLTQAFGVAGAIWLVTEIVTRVSSSADDWLTANGDVYLGGVLLVGAVWFVAYSYEQRKVKFQVPTTDSYITIKFGNLFEERSDWLIGVNEFFDGRLGQVVAKTTVHGQFITNVFHGDETRFRDAVTAALAGVPNTHTARVNLPAHSYKIGTTAVVANGSQKAFLVAMSRTDLITHKAASTVPMLWCAMKGALESVKNYGNGEPLALPLIGNGLSCVNIEPQHLLRLITLALVDFGRKDSLPKQVTIVVPEGCFEQLDIREIRRDWMKR
ncbi:macro domain-containing protein [Mesorhizobium sp. KR1-2]|uniref:macro domain-containing protein n=1 Tax=Mesorhizobium sp. KR1-2 TaxID=3156609 RepID=UPI0032B56A71